MSSKARRKEPGAGRSGASAAKPAAKPERKRATKQRAGASPRSRGGADRRHAGSAKHAAPKPRRTAGAAARTKSDTAVRRDAAGEPRRRSFARWLQLGLFAPAAPQAPPRPEIRVPARLRKSVPDEQARKLAANISKRLRVPLASLTVTDNRSVLLSTTRGDDGISLRLHRAFVEADREALDAAALFAGGVRGERRKEALARLRAHVDAWRDGNRREDRKRPRPATFARGAWHDLAAVRDSINARWFGGRVEPAITWGRWSGLRGARRRTIRLGSYDARDHLIRIHPALDQPWVPRMFVQAVVYHEMLHADMPPREGGVRRCLHSPEFRRREQLLPGYAAAESWLQANVHRLLKSRPRH